MKLNRSTFSRGINLYSLSIIFLLLNICAFAGTGQQDIHDDFERADVAGSIWDSIVLSTGNTATIDSSVFYSGTRGLKFSFNSANSAYLQKDITSASATAIDLSFRFRMDSTLLEDGDPVYLAALRDQNGAIFATFYYTISGGDRYFQADYRNQDGSWSYGAGTFTYILGADNWYHLHIKVNVDGTEGLSWRINEQQIFSTATDLYASTITHVDVGVVESEYVSTGSLYLDDIRWNYSTVDVEALDRGRVSLTFDDGLISNYTTLKPILDEYGFKASFYIVTEYQQDNAAYAMSVANLTELKNQGHQIQSHSHDHVNLTTLSQGDRMTSLTTSKTLLEGWGFGVFLFTLPFGAYNDEVLADTLTAGYSIISTTDEGYNNLSSIGAKTRIMRIDADIYTPAQLNAMIDAAMAQNLWIVLYYHKITGTGPGEVNGDENHTPDEIRAVFEHVNTNGYDVALQETMGTYPSTNTAPVNGVIIPASDSGTGSTFQIKFSDADGHFDFANTWFLVNADTGKANACYIRYDAAQNKFFLRSDDNSSWGGGITPGLASSISNSQVTLYAENSSFAKNTSNGSEATMTVVLEFKSGFVGLKNLYSQAEDAHGTTSTLASGGTYRANQFDVTVQTATGGSTNKDGLNWVTYQDSITITAIPSASYNFSGWGHDASGTANPLTISNVTSSKSVLPSFTYFESGTLQVSLNAGSSSGSYSISGPPGFNGGSALTAQTGNFNQLVPVGNYTVTFSDETGFDLNLNSSSFTVASSQASGTLASGGSETISGTYSVTQFNVHVGTTANGSTDKDGANLVNYGDSLSVTATPATNYIFTGWSGDNTGSDNPLTLTNIREDVSITPIFAEDKGTLAVSITAGSSGGSFTIAGPAAFNGGNPLTGQTSNFSQLVPSGSYTVTYEEISNFDISISSGSFSINSYQVQGALSAGSTENISGVYGLSFDINRDGSVTPGDALIVLKHYLGSEVITDPVSLARADANGDGDITPGDALVVLQAYLGAS